MLVVVIVAAGGIAAAVYGIAALRGGSDESRVRAFFTLPTRTACGAGDLAISVDDAHFAAFVAGSGVTSSQGRFMIVKYTVAGAPASGAPGLTGDFVLTEASGKHYSPLAGERGTSPAAGSPAAGQELLFDVPPKLGAAKLVFDDGCAHQEWIVP